MVAFYLNYTQHVLLFQVSLSYFEGQSTNKRSMLLHMVVIC